MRLAALSASITLIALPVAAANPNSEEVDRQIEGKSLAPIKMSSLSHSEALDRCKAFFAAVGLIDMIYQGGILGFDQEKLSEFAFARIGTPENGWATSGKFPDDTQAYMKYFGGLRIPSDQWDSPLFKSDKATCLALYEAGQ